MGKDSFIIKIEFKSVKISKSFWKDSIKMPINEFLNLNKRGIFQLREIIFKKRI